MITRALSENGTAWQLTWNGRTYNRNIMHMQPYSPDAHVLQEQRAVQDNTVQVGSYVAVLDSGEDQHYHLALVTEMTDQVRVLRYLGTGSTELRSAVWHWTYRRKRGKQQGISSRISPKSTTYMVLRGTGVCASVSALQLDRVRLCKIPRGTTFVVGRSSPMVSE